ncbi:MAG: hypothetical protein OEZ31_00920 [Nitrospirota bacterium]|nr:hypothetical protein [Nitrospirota bacterium]MDH5767507.1 hypothetical protein [Nitrospirota bacterium]
MSGIRDSEDLKGSFGIGEEFWLSTCNGAISEGFIGSFTWLVILLLSGSSPDLLIYR